MPGTLDRSGRYTRAAGPPPPDDTATPQTVVTLSRPLKIGAAVFGVLMLALLGVQLAFIVQQRAINSEQRNIARIQRDRARPVLQDSRVLLQNAREAFAPLQQGATRVDELVRGMNRADTPRAIAASGDLAGELARQRRLVRMVDGLNALLTDLARTGTVQDLDRARRIAADLLDLQRRAYDTNRQSLSTQKRTEAMFRESLAIQREVLEHTRSIDRKTGPTPPAAP